MIHSQITGSHPSVGKTMILIQVDEGKIENLRTLIEWALCRQEHVGHHVLLTACKDEIYIRQKLDVGAQQGLCAIFGIFGYLLKLVYGNIDSFLRLFQILEDMFERIFARLGETVIENVGIPVISSNDIVGL